MLKRLNTVFESIAAVERESADILAFYAGTSRAGRNSALEPFGPKVRRLNNRNKLA